MLQATTDVQQGLLHLKQPHLQLISQCERCVRSAQVLCLDLVENENLLEQPKLPTMLRFFELFSEGLVILASTTIKDEIEDFNFNLSQLLLVSKSFMNCLKNSNDEDLHDLLKYELLDNLTWWKIQLTQQLNKD